MVQTIAEPASDQPPIEKPRKSKGTYAVASPVVGNMEHRLPLDFSYNDDKVTALVPSVEAMKIRNYYYLNVYAIRENGLLYPDFGKIGGMATSATQPDKTLITLQMNPQIIEEQPKTGYLVLSKNPVAKRLPLSALSYDEEGTPYFWLVTMDPKNKNKGTAHKKTVRYTQTDDSFFDVGRAMRVDEFAILNPDPALQDGQTVKISYDDFDAPIGTEQNKALYTKANEGKYCEPAKGCGEDSDNRSDDRTSCGCSAGPAR